MQNSKVIMLASIAALAITIGCAGRDAHPVVSYRPGDGSLNCAAIDAEMQQINIAVVPLYDAAGDKTGWNIGWGLVGGLLFWPALFALDLSDAEMEEVRAYQSRWDNLMRMREQRNCLGPVPAMLDADGRVVRTAIPAAGGPAMAASAVAGTPTDDAPLIMSVQVALAQRGYWHAPHDGRMGRKLRNALMSFQKVKGIPVTGEPDPATLEKLDIAE